MIEKINAICEEIGSIFRTEDGLTLCAFIGAKDGEIKFLRRTFESQEDCYDFVASAKNSRK